MLRLAGLFEDGDNWPCKETTFRLCYEYGISLLDLFDFISDDLHKLPFWALEISVVNLDKETKETVSKACFPNLN